MRIDLTKLGTNTALERLPRPFRALLGCAAGVTAVAITDAVKPLHAVPFLIPFPAVILIAWYLGMWAGVFSALTSAGLVVAFITGNPFRFSPEFIASDVRMPAFLLASIFLGWAVRRLAQQRALLVTQELQQELTLVNAERRIAEERAQASEALRDRDDLLQIALRANGMGLWVWDYQQDVIHWSDEVYRIVGREPGSVEPGIDAWLSFIHPADIDAVRANAVRSHDGAEYHQQYRILRPDGSVRWVESQDRYQRDSGGRITRVSGVLADITSRKLSEEAMLRAEKLAVAGRLAASVAHEINNPLEAMANLLYLIAHGDSTEAARAHAQQALDELMRVSLITQQTLKFHRQAGTPKITKLSEIVNAVLVLFRGRMRSSQIEVEVQPEREVSISCMPGEVQQIVANLVSNAIDAMPRSGRLIVRLHPSRDWRDGKTPGMRVTFFDSGIGMDKATMERIFEPFFTTKVETGTGLGMWVVAQLVERHHGSVRVWSTRRGEKSATAISLFLPLGDVTSTDPSNEPA